MIFEIGECEFFVLLEFICLSDYLFYVGRITYTGQSMRKGVNKRKKNQDTNGAIKFLCNRLVYG